jgi:hypothetical protein
MQRTDLILGIAILFIIMGIFLQAITLTKAFTDPDTFTMKEVSCYDNHNSEIVGATCLRETQVTDKYNVPLFIGLGIIMFGVFGIYVWRTLKYGPQ